MAHLSLAESTNLISDWFGGLHLTDTDFRVERLEADYPDEPYHDVFQFRPARAGCFDLDILVSSDSYWGAGVMHPEHSKTVFAWGFEGTKLSCEAILRVAHCISKGQAEIIVSKFELSRTLGWLELPQDALKEIQERSRYDKIRSKTKTRFHQKRLRTVAWR